MEKLRVGVIGTGHLGRFHAEKLSQIEKADLVALVDINPKKAQEVVKRLREIGKSPNVFSNYQEIVQLVDAVAIVTPTFTHYEIAKFFIEKEKAVFLEKPITNDLKLAEDLVNLAEKKRVPLQIGYIERFQGAVKEAVSKVKNPVFIEAHRLSPFTERNLDIDVVLDLMIHDLDLVLMLKPGRKVEFIHAVGAPFFTNLPDIVNVRLVFDDGATCNLTASRLSLTRQRKLRIFEKGTYSVIDTLEKSFLYVKVNPITREYIQEKKSFPEDDPLREELVSFVEGVLAGRPLSPNGKDGLKSLELAFKIRDQVDQNLRRFL
ncbi:Gfo/Idh/MocA family oxidoreductase [Thermodesulfobacterium sp. TA1]|uniref:Gfo/Idh/MocA family protein n=1 Tax=Thermodesulfobacterium sp. TA1 TaxID=2234087 RepID=UPI001231F2C0|nr:Gfo/Idh/MocA family oxidoreductase [Thermodesulfobacterium sp. TA1]QER41548.1 Gfo/Idh/MocA family oxidoreductase [Thermodesulfobacterium sp. TA1]